MSVLSKYLMYAETDTSRLGSLFSGLVVVVVAALTEVPFFQHLSLNIMNNPKSYYFLKSYPFYSPLYPSI